MSDLINLAAESDRNIIGDDASPTLTLENISSGETLKLQNAKGTGVQLSGISCPTTAVKITGAAKVVELLGTVASTIKSAATEAAALDLGHSVWSSPTIAPLKLRVSTASGAVIDFASPLVSCASLTVHSFAIPIKHDAEDKIAYLVAYTIA